MTLTAKIFGSETRLRPLVKSLALVTALRAGWLAINAYPPTVLSITWALLPWLPHTWSWTVTAVNVWLLFYQLRAALRLSRALTLRFAPDAAAFLGLSKPAAEQPLTPRKRSWWPTALLLCALVMLSCCVVTWLVLMALFTQWAPFDLFMRTYYADRALLVGLALSVLGLLFGGRYIARAAGQVTTSFGVMTLDESHWLTVRVHGLAERLNLPKPAVGVTNVMNAFAMGAKQKSSMVVIGKPLFDFDKDELDAIIGHELGHILHNDVARMHFAEGFQRVLVTVVRVLTLIAIVAAATGSRRRSDAHRNVRLAMGSGYILRKTVFVGSELVAKRISRTREFHADAVGAHVTSPDAMARALKRIHGVADRPTAEERHYGYLMFRGAALGSLFATHPPLKARLNALGAPSDAYRVSQVEPVRAAPAPGPTATAVAAEAGHPIEPALSGTDMPFARMLGRTARRGVAFVVKRVTLRRLAATAAACLVIAMVAPAVLNFYNLERRFTDAKASAAQALTTSWQWVTETKEAWLGESEYTKRMRQVEAREQALKTAEAGLAAARSALDRQAAAGNRTLSTAVADRDLARRQVQDLTLQLDAANAERTSLSSRLAQQQDSPLQAASLTDLQSKVGTLTSQLAAMTADRDEMVRRNDELRQMNLELKGQIADRDMARVDLDKQIHAFQDQIASLTTGQPPGEVEPVEPIAPPQQSTAMRGYGAFAVAANGIVILTDRSYPSGQTASDAAIAECVRLSKGSRCDVERVFQNTCAAVARVAPVSRKSPYRLQLEATIRDAEEMALSECYHRNHQQPCEVTRQVCVP